MFVNEFSTIHCAFEPATKEKLSKKSPKPETKISKCVFRDCSSTFNARVVSPYTWKSNIRPQIAPVFPVSRKTLLYHHTGKTSSFSCPLLVRSKEICASFIGPQTTGQPAFDAIGCIFRTQSCAQFGGLFCSVLSFSRSLPNIGTIAACICKHAQGSLWANRSTYAPTQTQPKIRARRNLCRGSFFFVDVAIVQGKLWTHFFLTFAR